MDPAPKHASPTSESTAHPPANPNLTAMPHLNPTPATKMPTPMPMTPIMTMIIMMILIIGGLPTFKTNLKNFSQCNLSCFKPLFLTFQMLPTLN